MTDTTHPLLPSHSAIIAALTAADGPVTTKHVARWITKNIGLNLDRRTLVTSLTEMTYTGQVTDVAGVDNGPRRWALVTPRRAA